MYNVLEGCKNPDCATTPNCGWLHVCPRATPENSNGPYQHSLTCDCDSNATQSQPAAHNINIPAARRLTRLMQRGDGMTVLGKSCASSGPRSNCKNEPEGRE
eukprot:11789093-Alexandrium_andersonii.AAC.1